MKPNEFIAEQQVEARAAYRGRLFRKYFFLILGLVSGALIISGAIGVYFSYQENRAALARLQREKAVAAAAIIDTFVRRIEEQLGFAALAQLGAGGTEQRRIEFLKLLRQAPAITDVAYLDAKGNEQLAVSRLAMDVAGSTSNRAEDPAFKGAKPGQTWFGPVYFRKETEPYMAIAVRSGGETGAVTVAEVNLKFIWDVITRIKIGVKGKAYVVDATGFLVADPDIGQVLRKTNLSALLQVKSALSGADDGLAVLAEDLTGAKVLTAFAPIEPLGWRVFVEQPVAEVYATLDATIIRTGALLIAGLLFSVLAAMWLARNMVRPIATLQEGAQRIGAGDLSQKIDVRTGDELEALAGQFNDMSVRLRESYAGLERKVEERTVELKQALEFQGASGEILSSISGSIADTKPVFDAIVRNLLHLFGTRFATVTLLRDGQMELGAFHGEPGFEHVLVENYPRPLNDRSLAGRAMLSGQVVHMTPCLGNPEAPPITVEVARKVGFDSLLAAPMIREDKVIGAITTAHRDAVPFSDKQVALIKAFADQAVIAIENARLFNETKEALERQTATAEVLKAISRSTFELEPVLQTLLDNVTRLSGAERAIMLRPDAEGNYLPAVSFNYERDQPLLEGLRKRPIRPGRDSINGRALLERRPIHVPDVLADPEYGRKDLVEISHYRTVLAVPMLRDGEPIGLISLTKGTEVDPFTDKQMELVTTFADQAVIAIENVRLLLEIQEKSRQLEIANQHKSDFLANMSHELRTPLNAIIGFSEVLMERMFGEVNEKQADYLKDIHESGRHLLSLINDILDLSKIEAGRMDLEISSFDLPSALSNAMTLVRERAQRHGIKLKLEVDPRLGEFQADERKFKQIVLNLLSNAVKFTPDGGRVKVKARLDTGKVEIAVKDTGIGIAPEDHASVFEEFKQVGRDYTRKAEGTGLGLALTKRFVELHGGEIRLESVPGKGSKFTISLPVRT